MGMMAAMVLPTLLFLATRFVDTDDEPVPVAYSGASRAGTDPT
jgi:hypothetical protein